MTAAEESKARYWSLRNAGLCPRCKGETLGKYIVCYECRQKVLKNRDPEKHKAACRAWRERQ